MAEPREEDIERVAQAIFLSDYPGDPLTSEPDFMDEYRNNARAALRALAAAGRLQDPELDAACFSVYLHGNWWWLTKKMTTEEREAFADAADRHRATWPVDDQGSPMNRWWRDDTPTLVIERIEP
ncbi:hypothetical protein [Micromonospora maritima]|uniref:hypothetical protein n=1 Tax=Micromonospora maritima TaxID=986711 RepID=UPI00157DB908|nr:hypothetical protein [Micromonospora maritima]